MEENTKNLIEMFFNLAQLIVVLAGAIWAYFRFRKENPLHPRIEFDIKCAFWGPQHNSYLTEFVLTADNKGNVDHQFNEIRLRVLGIKSGEPFSEFAKYPPMTCFNEKIIDEVNIIPPKYKYYFVRPGVCQTFNYVSQVSEDIRFILVRATFFYEATHELHTAERVFEVRETNV